MSTNRYTSLNFKRNYELTGERGFNDSNSATNVKSISEQNNSSNGRHALEVVLHWDEATNKGPFNFVAACRENTMKQLSANPVSAPQASHSQSNSY